MIWRLASGWWNTNLPCGLVSTRGGLCGDSASPFQRRTALVGQTGLFAGVAIAPDGSNINAVALTVLNARNPDGSLVIPSPQITGTGVNYGAPTTMRSE